MVSLSSPSVAIPVPVVREDLDFVLRVNPLLPGKQIRGGISEAALAPHIHALGEAFSPNAESPAEDPYSSLPRLSTDYTWTHPTQKVPASFYSCGI